MIAVSRRIAVGLALLAGFIITPFGSPTATADPIGNCTTTTGTIVAVDFAHWGGPIVRGCGVNSATGYALLQAAGFTTAGDRHDGAGFICRLGNGAFNGGAQYPTAAQDACIVTPPATAYWSYWLAPAGQNTWSYSPRGAATEVPKPGEVEAWVFGATNTAGTSGGPTFSPASVRAQYTAPPATSAPAGSTTSSTQRSTAPIDGFDQRACLDVVRSPDDQRRDHDDDNHSDDGSELLRRRHRHRGHRACPGPGPRPNPRSSPRRS